jgi:putative nucleotide binding protein
MYPARRKFYFEEYVYILSYNIPMRMVKEKRHYIPGIKIKEVYSQTIGRDYFTLLEVVSDADVKLSVGELVNVGKDKTKIKRVSARLLHNELSDEAKANLATIIRRIIKENEAFFINFFNTAGPLSPRVHSFELLPKIGKKTMEKILYERRIKAFESYEDIKKRIGISNLEEILYERIMLEVTSTVENRLNYYIFAKGIENTIEERSRPLLP